MRILVIGRNAWDDTDSTGNTFSNWFEDWEGGEFYYLYTRETLPNNRCCRHYMSITLSDIVRNLFTPRKIGHVFTMTDAKMCMKQKPTLENRAINNISGFWRIVALFAVDMLYATRIWMNRNFRMYIKEANPDIVFLSSHPSSYHYHTLKYIKKNTSAKIVQFVADDLYIKYVTGKSLLDKIYRKRFPKVLLLADKIYGASPQLCSNYDKIFNKSLTPLYKGCTISEPRKYVNEPVRMMYAGNLRFGRLETLGRLASVLAKINRNGQKIVLDIYSNTYISEESKKMLVKPGSVKLHDVLPYSEVTKRLKDSDIVLHVESFDEELKLNVRFSFSTKIIDCLQSGSTLMVIGPKGISSVEYPRQIEGTIVIDDVDDIERVVTNVIHDSHMLPTRAAAINKFAKANHSIESVRTMLHNEFKSLTAAESLLKGT